MAPGFDQICMSRPRIIYLDLALPASPPCFSATRHIASGMETRRGAFGIIGERRRVRRRQRENEELKRKTRGGQKKKEGKGGGGYVSTGYAGNINTAGLSNEPECDLRIFQRVGGLAWNRAPTEQSYITCRAMLHFETDLSEQIYIIYFHILRYYHIIAFNR